MNSGMKNWQKWGLRSVALSLVLHPLLNWMARRWFFEETIWYSVLMLVDYPAAWLDRVFLNWARVPRIYDSPLEPHEAVIINLSGLVFGVIWWFILGAVLSTLYGLMHKARRQSKM